TAVAGNQVDAHFAQVFFRGDEVFLATRPAAERDDGRVFNEEQAFLVALGHPVMNLLLVRPRLAVRHEAQILDDHWRIVWGGRLCTHLLASACQTLGSLARGTAIACLNRRRVAWVPIRPKMRLG